MLNNKNLLALCTSNFLRLIQFFAYGDQFLLQVMDLGGVVLKNLFFKIG
jgi:hypothetical protein